MSMSKHAARDDDEKEESNIKVVVRVRPRFGDERICLKQGQQMLKIISPKEIELFSTFGSSKVFKYDRVYDDHTSQQTIFEDVAKPVCADVLRGYSCTLICYGQTGTGKTHTMEGDVLDDVHCGLIPRVSKELIRCLSENDISHQLSVSFIEIYNENIYDLLSVTENLMQLKLCTSSTGLVVAANAMEKLISRPSDIKDVLLHGAQHRKTAATKLNAKSSRSHAVFRLKVIMDDMTGVRTGYLHLVDLAGSENIGRSGAVEKRAREAGSINQSLLTIARVIQALVEKHPHVPYRDSKLTRILQDALGGTSKTTMIATIGPDVASADETMSTLDYALKTQHITNKPTVNMVKSSKETVAMLQKQLMSMTKELEAVYTKENCVTMSRERYNTLMAENDRVMNDIAVLKLEKDQNEKKLAVLTELEEMVKQQRQQIALLNFSLVEKETDEVDQEIYAENLFETAADLKSKTVNFAAKTERYAGVMRDNTNSINNFHHEYQSAALDLGAYVAALQSANNDLSSVTDGVRNQVDLLQSFVDDAKDDVPVMKAATPVLTDLERLSSEWQGALEETSQRMAGYESSMASLSAELDAYQVKCADEITQVEQKRDAEIARLTALIMEQVTVSSREISDINSRKLARVSQLRLELDEQIKMRRKTEATQKQHLAELRQQMMALINSTTPGNVSLVSVMSEGDATRDTFHNKITEAVHDAKVHISASMLPILNRQRCLADNVRLGYDDCLNIAQQLTPQHLAPTGETPKSIGPALPEKPFPKARPRKILEEEFEARHIEGNKENHA